MLIIRNFVAVMGGGDKQLIRAEISIEDESELVPETDTYIFADGSIAWNIKTGKFYGIAGGVWYKQDGSGAVS